MYSDRNSLNLVTQSSSEFANYQTPNSLDDPASLVPTLTFRGQMPDKLLELLLKAEQIVASSYFEYKNTTFHSKSAQKRNTNRIYTQKRAKVRLQYRGGQYEGNVAVSMDREGFGCMFNKHELYIGEWIDGSRNGQGIQISDNGNIFYGSFINGQQEGLGVII
jgi:hypothetical protein